MIYLIGAFIASTFIVICFKLFPKFKIDVLAALTVNYFVAAALGMILSKGMLAPKILFAEAWFPYSLLIGFFFIAVFFLFGISTQKIGMAITSVFSKMSVVIPVTVGFIIFKEEKSFLKYLGIALAIASFYFVLKKENTGKKEKLDIKYIFLPIILFLGTGINDSLLKITQTNFISSDIEYLYLLNVIFAIAFIVGIAALGYRVIKTKKNPISLKVVLAGICLGVVNWLSTFSILKAINLMDASVFFPIFNVGIVSITALIGFFVFKEKLRLVNWIGIFIAIASILLIAFGA